jgi:hypothetical protein
MKARWILVAGLALLAVGCGGSTSPSTAASNPSTPTPTPSPRSTAQVAQSYLSAASAVDAAYATWHSALIAANGNVLKLTSQAAAYAAVLTTFDTTIQGIGATGQAAGDIATLVTDDNTVIADLNALPAQTASTESNWDTKAIADGLAAVAQGDVVRADLGLPASS